jgi:hypothetical protein
MSGSLNVGSSVTANSTFTLIGGNATNNTENAIAELYDANSNLMGKIVGFRGANGAQGNLRIYTNNTTPTLAMTITSAGNINLYDQKHQLAFYNAGNFQINFGQYYNVTSQTATNTDGGRLLMVDGGFLFKTFTGGTVNSTVADSERMRITSGGQVGVATTTIASAFNMQVGNNSGVIATTILRLQDSYLSGTTGYYGAQITAVDNGVDGHNLLFQTRANATSVFSTRMTITTTGNIGAPSGTNIYNASDVRLKKNISTTTYGLDAISALNPVKFNWVDGFEPSEDGKDMLGFVAQEVLEVIPEAVESFGGDINLNGELIDNPLRVNEKFIIPVLVKSIQELKSENDTLKEILQRNNIQ